MAQGKPLKIIKLLVTSLVLIPFSIPAFAVHAVTEPLDPEKKGLNFNFSVGYQLDKGNTQQNKLVSELATIITKDCWGFNLFGGLEFQNANEERVKNKGSLVFRLDYFFKSNPNFRLFAYTAHSTDEFQLIHYRGSYGAGPWLDIRWEKFYLSPSLAIDHSRENFAGFPNEAIERFSLRLLANWTLSETASLGFDVFYVPALGDSDDIQASLKTFIKTAVVRDAVSLKLEATVGYDSLPKPGVRTTDQSLVSSIEFKLK